MIFNRSINIKSQFKKRQGISFWKIPFYDQTNILVSLASSYDSMVMNTLGMLNILSPRITSNGKNTAWYQFKWDKTILVEWNNRRTIKIRSFPTMQLNAKTCFVPQIILRLTKCCDTQCLTIIWSICYEKTTNERLLSLMTWLHSFCKTFSMIVHIFTLNTPFKCPHIIGALNVSHFFFLLALSLLVLFIDWNDWNVYLNGVVFNLVPALFECQYFNQFYFSAFCSSCYCPLVLFQLSYAIKMTSKSNLLLCPIPTD